MAFDEVQFPPDIAWGATGGPGFSTGVLTTVVGYEFRNRQWSSALAQYDVTHATRTQEEMDTLVAFYRARNGTVRGFRFKDWMDFKLQMDPTIVTDGTVNLGAGDDLAAQTFQLLKSYGDAESTYLRVITKPVAGTVTLDTDQMGLAAERLTAHTGTISSPVSDGDYFVEHTTGLITWHSLGTDTTTSGLNAGVTTELVWSPGTPIYRVGMSIYITGVTGTAASIINNKRWKVTNKVGNVLTIDADTSSGTLLGQATIEGVPQAAEQVRARTFDFDVPVRFAADKMPVTIDSFERYSAEKIVLTEIRDPSISLAQTEPTNTFHHVRLDPKITFGATGAPRFKTNVFTTTGGHTARINTWEEDRPEYDVSEGLKDHEDFQNILDFFYARYGKAYGFRFRDWQDYDLTVSTTAPTALFGNTSFTTAGAPAGQSIINHPSGNAWVDDGYKVGTYVTVATGINAGSYLIAGFGVEAADDEMFVQATLSVTTYLVVTSGNGDYPNIDVPPDGSTTAFKLIKPYPSGDQVMYRQITCPIEPSEEIVPAKYGSQQLAADFVISLGGVDIDHDANANFFDVNGRTLRTSAGAADGISHGTLDFGLTVRDGQSGTADTFTITNITQANPAVVTVTEDIDGGTGGVFVEGMGTGETIYISGVSGMTQINDRRFKITRLTGTTFELDGEDSTGHTAFSGPGVGTKTPQTGELLAISGEFDVPVRFSADEMSFTHENYGFFTWGGIPLEGVRLK